MENTLVWYRYIDDLFLIWTGTSEQLLQLVDLFNENNLNLRFTVQFDDVQIHFLDLVIIKQLDGTLSTNLYRKPMAGNTLLYATSAHPKPLIRSIPFVQYFRIRINCTLQSDLKIQANALREHLLLRYY